MASFVTYIPSGGIAISIIIILSIFIIYTFISTYHIYNVGYQMLGGLWEADPSFNLDTGLDRFYIFIDPPENGNICWIVMANKTQMIVNHMTTYNISNRWDYLDNWTTDVNRPRYYNIKFSKLPENLINDCNFPKIQTIKLEIKTGKIYLLSPNVSNDETEVYFVGYKDSRVSDLIEIDKSVDSLTISQETENQQTEDFKKNEHSNDEPD